MSRKRTTYSAEWLQFFLSLKITTRRKLATWGV